MTILNSISLDDLRNIDGGNGYMLWQRLGELFRKHIPQHLETDGLPTGKTHGNGAQDFRPSQNAHNQSYPPSEQLPENNPSGELAQ